MPIFMRYGSAASQMPSRSRIDRSLWDFVRLTLPLIAFIGWSTIGPITPLLQAVDEAKAEDKKAEEEEEEELDAKPAPKPPFVAPAAKVETLEALEDFRRAVRKNKWEKAFKEIEKLVAETSVGLVSSKDGLQLPLRTTVAVDLAKLPPHGKNAYRLFHDAEAKKGWDQLQNPAGNNISPTDELEKLNRLATLELITSVGDLASNRLGNMLFEQGDMLGAIDAWQRILDHRPDSSIPRAQLLVKTGIALANAGRWRELEEIQRQLTQRHAGETVVLGEKKVVATEHIEQLLKKHQAIELGLTSPIPEDLVLEEKVEPVWQFRYDAKDSQNQPTVQRGWNMFGMPNMVSMSTAPVAAAVSGDSLFANWLGCDFALDLTTGKIRWRNGRIQEVAQRTKQNQNNGIRVPGDRFALTIQGDSLWVVGQTNQQANQNQNRQPNQAINLPVIRRELSSGKELFSTRDIEELKQYTILGSPLPADNMLYLVGCKPNQPTELHVLAVQVNAARVQWTTHVGTFQFNPLDGNNSTKPTMLLHGTRLYLDTHAGGLVELQASTGAIRWAYTYPSKPPAQNNNMWGWWGWDYYSAPQTNFGPNGPMIGGGELYVKGMQSSRLVALKPDGSAVDWKRAVPSNSMMVGSDDQRIYMAGEESLAFSLKTQKLLWANSLPTGTSGIRPILTQNRYYQFTPRGIYELDKATGDVVRLIRGADRDSQGGVLLATPNLLITISSKAITAYPLKRSTEVAQREAESSTPSAAKTD